MSKSAIRRRINALLIAGAMAVSGVTFATMTAPAQADQAAIAPTLGCDGETSRMATGVDAEGKKIPIVKTGGAGVGEYGEPATPTKDLRWSVASNAGAGYPVANPATVPSAANFELAQVGGYSNFAYQAPINGQWITSTTPITESHSGTGEAAFYYKLNFDITDERVANNLNLWMRYRVKGRATNAWINSARIELPAGQDRTRDGDEVVSIWMGAGQFKPGSNQLIVEVVAEPTAQGFQADFGALNRYDTNGAIGASAHLCPVRQAVKVGCDGKIAPLNTGLDADGNKIKLYRENENYGLTLSTDLHWQVADGAEIDRRALGKEGYANVAGKLPADTADWREARVAGWLNEQTPDAQWISGSNPFSRSQNDEVADQPRAFYYRVAFDLENAAIADNMQLTMNYVADDEVAAMWLNGDPVANAAGASRPAAKQVQLDGLKEGRNELIVQVLSAPPTQAFKAWFTAEPKQPVADPANPYCPVPKPVVPTIGCDTKAEFFNTGVDPQTGKLYPISKEPLVNANDLKWLAAGGRDGFEAGIGDPAPQTADFAPAVVIGWLADKPSWAGAIAAEAPFGDNPLINQTVRSDNALQSFYFRTNFQIDQPKVAQNLVLDATFAADDYVAAVWVNGERVFVNEELAKFVAAGYTGPRWTYSDVPSKAKNIGAVQLKGFQAGENSIEIQLASYSNAERLKVSFAYPADTVLCPVDPDPLPVDPEPSDPQPVEPQPEPVSPSQPSLRPEPTVSSTKPSQEQPAPSATKQPTDSAKPAKPSALPRTGGDALAVPLTGLAVICGISLLAARSRKQR